MNFRLGFNFLNLSLIFSLNAQEGLFKVKDTKVPGVIEIAGESVLQIVLTGEVTQRVPAASYEAYLRSDPRENLVLALTIKKIQRCKERSLPICEINYQGHGSGFITDDGRTLWSARHVFDKQLIGKANPKLSFELYNADGEMLFDSADNKDQVSIASLGDGNLIQKQHAQKFILDDGLSQLCSDYIKLKLNRNLAVRALRISSKKPQLDQRVYAVGYANISNYRAIANTGAVKNRSRVAIGAISPHSESSPNENAAAKQSRLAYESVASQHLLVMHLDGLPGQSGSPVLNEAGEVVGIFVAGNSTISDRGALRGIAPHFEGIFKNGH